MSEESSKLQSCILKYLDTKLNSLVVGNCCRKTKESEDGGRSSQTEMIKDPIQVKKGVENMYKREAKSISETLMAKRIVHYQTQGTQRN